MLAGFMGAFASQFWFLAFALTAAANVRTLALVEVLFAQAVAYYSFKQPLSARELSGIVLIVIGRGAAGGGLAIVVQARCACPPSRRTVMVARFALPTYGMTPRQFRSSGSTGSGETSTPSSISARASSGEASP